MNANNPDRLERVPPEPTESSDRASRTEILDWWRDRFGVNPSAFDGFSFWEKGAGKLWVVRGDEPSPMRVEALGMRVLHTRQEYWKPTTNAAQRFGGHATRNTIPLNPGEATRFVAGRDQSIEWDGDWGYLIATHEIDGDPVPIGVGLYTYGELKSTVPKNRRFTPLEAP